MSRLQDNRPLRTPGISPRRPTRRGIAWTVAVLLVAAATSGLLYRDRYQPLTAGSMSGAGPDSGILALSDGLDTTRWMVGEPGGQAYFEFSVANRGRYAVKIQAMGDSIDASATPSASVLRASAIPSRRAAWTWTPCHSRHSSSSPARRGWSA